ncbi:cytidine and deoxycytidylate deaminase zinc-binding region family protein [Candidatus Phytoplasma oryzae]|nr:cytidine and deoxycytidylate deaminase zinc-binding region family protein [Candidatus Phytoplasma oryzae]
MKEALKEAQKAFLKNEVPIGAVAVLKDKIVARAHNNIENKKLFFAHAEFLVLSKLNQKIKNYKFEEISIYTTLEPCIMCIGALIQARIKKLYYGASNFKSGFIEHFNIKFSKLNTCSFKNIFIQSGCLSEESSIILKKFFLNLRKNN